MKTFEREGCVNEHQPAGYRFLRKTCWPILFERIEGELARQRQLSKLEHIGERVSLAPNGANERGKALEIVAKKVGLSPRTFRRAVMISTRNLEKRLNSTKEVGVFKTSLKILIFKSLFMGIYHIFREIG